MKITSILLLWVVYVQELVVPVPGFDPVVQISSCFLTAIWVEVTNASPAYVNLNTCTPQPFVAGIVIFALGISCFDPLPGPLEVFTVYVQQDFVFNPATDKVFECYCNGPSGICSDVTTTTVAASTTTTTTTITTTTSIGLATGIVTPKAIMTLTDDIDNPLTVAYIGDPVKLNVALETHYMTAFDIIGWSCTANSHTLIDMGCSVVSYFPTFTHPAQGRLTSSFNMFMFVATNQIAYHCTLKVCAGVCINTLTCPANMNEVAWGRRKRDAMSIIEKETIATVETSVYVRIRQHKSGSAGITRGRCSDVLLSLTILFVLCTV